MADTKEIHDQLCQELQEAAEQYLIDRTIALTAFQNLADDYQGAKQALIDSGALQVDRQGNIKAGWYQDSQSYQDQRVAGKSNAGVAAGGGALGIAGAIGAPAAAWTLVGAFGTASTGAAISGLSGAAATSATAAWFGGGAVAAGGWGVAAAPFMLTGIGAVVGVTILGAASLIALSRHRQNDSQRKDANETIREAQKRMTANANRMKGLGTQSRQASIRLIKATGVLEENKTPAAVEQVGAALLATEQLFAELQNPLPYNRLYLGRPSPIPEVESILQTKNTITLKWKDPDAGESEIAGYRIRYKQGFWGDEKLLTTFHTKVKDQTLTHKDLTPGKTYYYKIIPFNEMGEAQDNEEFKAATNPA